MGDRLRDIETQEVETQRYRISEGSLRDKDTQGWGETQRYKDSRGKKFRDTVIWGASDSSIQIQGWRFRGSDSEGKLRDRDSDGETQSYWYLWLDSEI